jgi:hypothetical protein
MGEAEKEGESGDLRKKPLDWRKKKVPGENYVNPGTIDKEREPNVSSHFALKPGIRRASGIRRPI